MDHVDQETSDTKIILVITDGYGNGPVEVEELIGEARRKHIEVIGIGVGCGMEYVKSVCYPHAAVERMDALPHVVARILMDVIVHKQRTPVNFVGSPDLHESRTPSFRASVGGA